jgi:hypothetical protein
MTMTSTDLVQTMQTIQNQTHQIHTSNNGFMLTPIFSPFYHFYSQLSTQIIAARL